MKHKCAGGIVRSMHLRVGGVCGAALLLCACASGSPATSPRHSTSTAGRQVSPASPRTSAPAPMRVNAAELTGRLPFALSRPVVYPTGTSLLVVGGLTASDTTTSAIQRLDPGTGQSTSVGSLPVGVHDAAGAIVAGRNLLFGGGSTNVSSAVQEVFANAPAKLVGHLPAPRADLVATSDGRHAFVLGGFDGNSPSTTILQTDDGTGFLTVGSLPLPVRYPALCFADGSIWLFGGESGGQPVDAVQRIDPTTGRATLVGHLSAPLAHAGAFVLNGSIFLAGGKNESGAVGSILRFDSKTLTFTQAGTLPEPRSDFGVAVLGDTAYLVGGENPHTLDTTVAVRAQNGSGQ